MYILFGNKPIGKIYKRKDNMFSSLINNCVNVISVNSNSIVTHVYKNNSIKQIHPSNSIIMQYKKINSVGANFFSKRQLMITNTIKMESATSRILNDEYLVDNCIYYNKELCPHSNYYNNEGICDSVIDNKDKDDNK